MRRNAGTVGQKKDTTTSVASGIYDELDQYSAKKSGAWPLVAASARLTLNNTIFNEGQTIACTVYTTGINTGTSLSWRVVLVSGNSLQSTDFPALSGTVTVTASYADVISLTINSDALTEGTEVFKIEVLYNSNVIATSSNFTVNDTSTGTAEPQALYSFTTFTFTNAGINGRTGPTLANCLASYNTATYPWLTNTSYFNVITQGYQLWTAPASGSYQITAVGAAGGTGYTTYTSGQPGKGAQMQSTFTLTAGDKLIIIVGHVGGSVSGSCGQNGAGGGGSFVVFNATGALMLAAGGGGGGGGDSNNTDLTLKDAPNSTSGTKGSGSTGGAGGTNGAGGSVQVGSCVNGGGAGAGFNGAGAINGQSIAAQPYSNGFTGGQGGQQGGFGGGGGNGTSYAAGGGGGYSGGGGGGLYACSCTAMGSGGAGGSYSSTTFTYTGGIGTSNGYVIITKL